MSAATAGYAVFSLARPRHLGRLLSDDPVTQQTFDSVARVYGVRDLATSAVVLLGRGSAARRLGMGARIAFDTTDAAILASSAQSRAARAKVLGAALGWAALNLVALIADERAADARWPMPSSETGGARAGGGGRNWNLLNPSTTMAG
jgi:hypothetical protein